MEPRIMGSISYRNQIYPDCQVPSYSFIPNISLKLVICLLLSVGYSNQFVSVPK
jgi:hypothetical protein